MACSFVFFVLFVFFFNRVIGQQMIQVDDDDPAITYTGPWDASDAHLSPLNFGGSHRLLQDPSGRATFKFTGVGIDYLSSLWPYTVDTTIQLDNNTPVIVNLTTDGPMSPNGEETVRWSVVWSVRGLANREHTVVVTTGPRSGYGIVDGFQYYTELFSSNVQTTHVVTSTIVQVSSETGTSSNQSSSPYSTTIPVASNIKPLIIGISVSVSISLILLVILLLVFLGRRRKAREDSCRQEDTIYDTSTYAIPSSSVPSYVQPRPYVDVSTRDPNTASKRSSIAKYPRPDSIYSSMGSNMTKTRGENVAQMLWGTTGFYSTGVRPRHPTHDPRSMTTSPSPSIPGSQTAVTDQRPFLLQQTSPSRPEHSLRSQDISPPPAGTAPKYSTCTDLPYTQLEVSSPTSGVDTVVSPTDSLLRTSSVPPPYAPRLISPSELVPPIVPELRRP